MIVYIYTDKLFYFSEVVMQSSEADGIHLSLFGTKQVKTKFYSGKPVENVHMWLKIEN